MGKVHQPGLAMPAQLAIDSDGKVYGVIGPDGKVYGLGLGGNLVNYETNPVTGGVEVSANGVNMNTLFADQVTDGYFCHLWAGSSGNGDAVIPDISGADRHGAFNTNMTKALCWANPGFASTDTGGAYRSFLLPNLNFDYAGGESLIVVWKGRGTPRATAKAILGDSAGSSEPGFAIRCNADGTLQPYLSDGTGRFLNTTGVVAVEPTVTHTFAFAVNGVTRRHEMHVDGVPTPSTGYGGHLNGTQDAWDTRSAKVVKLGTQDDFADPSNIVPLQTQALVILRGRKGLGWGDNYRQLMQAIARQPDRLVTKDWW